MGQHDEDMPDHMLDEIVEGLSDELDVAIQRKLMTNDFENPTFLDEICDVCGRNVANSNGLCSLCAAMDEDRWGDQT